MHTAKTAAISVLQEEAKPRKVQTGRHACMHASSKGGIARCHNKYFCPSQETAHAVEEAKAIAKKGHQKKH